MSSANLPFPSIEEISSYTDCNDNNSDNDVSLAVLAPVKDKDACKKITNKLLPDCYDNNSESDVSLAPVKDIDACKKISNKLLQRLGADAWAEAEGEACPCHLESQLSLRFPELDEVKLWKPKDKKKANKKKANKKKVISIFSLETLKYCCTLSTTDVWVIFFMVILYLYYGASDYVFLKNVRKI